MVGRIWWENLIHLLHDWTKKEEEGMPLLVSRGPYLLKTPLPLNHTMGSQSDTLHV